MDGRLLKESVKIGQVSHCHTCAVRERLLSQWCASVMVKAGQGISVGCTHFHCDMACPPLFVSISRDEALGVTPGRTASSANLGGSSKYLDENFED